MSNVINDGMRQYWRSTEEIRETSTPKHPKEYGIKLPEAYNIVAVLTGLFLFMVVASQVM
jgi:hypothetical protein